MAILRGHDGAGSGLGLGTLPFTGIDVWFHWLEVGGLGTEIYLTNENWITLSRDLHGLPRRALIDFSIFPESDRLKTPAARLATVLGWAAWVFVFATTAVVYLWRGDRRRPTGLGAGLLFLGAWLCCYRFMYYDALVSVVPVIVLMADPARWLRGTAFDLRTAPDRPVFPVDPKPVPAVTARPPDPCGPNWVGYVNSFVLTVVFALLIGDNWLISIGPMAELAVDAWTQTDPVVAEDGLAHSPRISVGVTYYYPWDTVLILTLWAWAALRLIWRSERTGVD